MLHSRRAGLCFFVVASSLAFASLARSEPAGPITDKGRELLKSLDSLRVEKLWQPGVHVDWKTGEADGTKKQPSTHCSAFAAAACNRLGIYLLCPPDHSQVLLANAQHDWLTSDKGKEKGWSQVASAVEAQRLANQGMVVVASLKAPDAKKSGHIAVVRPSDKDTKVIAVEGPDITQAGRENANCTSVKYGFRHHNGAFEKMEIHFFVCKPK